MDYTTNLNKQQANAVLHTEGQVIVSAGAGTGKTKVLTNRIAHLIDNMNINPYNIVAITFTNKAAGEMKERVESMVENTQNITICTFHSLCARILRQYASNLEGFDKNFSIYDDSDKNKLLKKIFANFNIDTGLKSSIEYHIAKIKNDNLDVKKYVNDISYIPVSEYIEKVFFSYQEELKNNNAMDFDDLLFNTYRILSEKEDVRQFLQNRYKYILVDEFQDTNTIQFDIVKILADKHKNIFVVGDEDQLIYSWRGANNQNINNFRKLYKEHTLYKLEQNYRCTKEILDKANKLIKNNSDRIDKTLFTANDNGEIVEFSNNYDENAEADYVVRTIVRYSQMGYKLSDFAILMRINALSRVFEEKLLMYNIPHRIYGGFRFYERAEIKNVLSYMTVINNTRDSQNILRIINFPKRGIGNASIEKMEIMAKENNISLFELIENVESFNLGNNIKNKILPLSNIFKILKEAEKNMSLSDFAEELIKVTNIKSAYSTDDETDQDRKLNINQLLQAIKEYDRANDDATLTDYLESVTLVTTIEKDLEDDNCVTLASVHSAKGLEFPIVFIVGMEEKIFPLQRNGDVENIEEERRLLYVACTRAEKKLFITAGKSRFVYGNRERTLPSRFLAEMGIVLEKPRNQFNNYEENFAFKNYANSTQFPFKSNTGNKSSQPSNITNEEFLGRADANIGVNVCHSIFGTGTIVDNSSVNDNGTVTINFKGFGNKTLALEYAKLKKI